jgi:2-polyprenyl-3-methyl-5-hydroxy-6-metoxy-1,4-benzoquinol methylase
VTAADAKASGTQAEPPRCVVCGAERSATCETARVRSNVRAFKNQRFEIWRCASCRSLHAADEVDLDHYYRGYPVFAADLDWRLDVVYGGMLKRLLAAGVQKEHRILDYGCGKGLLVQFLRQRGYENAVGWDRYAEGWSDSSVLQGRYDAIVSQDVIEHVADPNAMLRQLDGMLEPGGFASIGTPDAAALDLSDPESFVHALHLPFHRHILSHGALQRAGERVGWAVERFYDTMYNNTWFPTMNPRFVLHYVRSHDDVFDLVAEPIKLSWKLLSPATPFFALFGYLFDRHTDVQVTFRKPG